MSPRALACSVAIILASGCTSRTNPGPIHRCAVVDWEEYESHCTCDPQPLPADPEEQEVIDRGTMVGLFAPPGSLPPGAPVVIDHGGTSTSASVASDGSLGVYVRNGGGVDLRGTRAAVHVAGATYTFDLVAQPTVGWGPAGVDPRFSEDDVAIEDPTGTIAVSARLTAWAEPSAIEHFAIGTTLPFVGEWMTPPPRVGDVITWTGPGQEGTPIGFVALHASGAASGCYMGGGSGGRCGCSRQRRAAGECRYEVVATRPDGGADAGSFADADMEDAGVEDAGVEDAGEGDAGAPF